MSDIQAGLEASAGSVLRRAVEHDEKGEYSDSLVCYSEGIQLLLDATKALPAHEESKRKAFQDKIRSFMDRAEKVKTLKEEQKSAQCFNTQYHISDGSVGHSYELVFGKLLTPALHSVQVDDPYVRSVPQIFNFLRFCEMLVKSKAPVVSIRLMTTRDEHNHRQQLERLQELKASLSEHAVDLQLQFSATLHDREIRFSNGWIVKIGRGLDYFKSPKGKFVVGFCDYNLRPCKETTVDIFPAPKTQQH